MEKDVNNIFYDKVKESKNSLLKEVEGLKDKLQKLEDRILVYTVIQDNNYPVVEYSAAKVFSCVTENNHNKEFDFYVSGSGYITLIYLPTDKHCVMTSGEHERLIKLFCAYHNLPKQIGTIQNITIINK